MIDRFFIESCIHAFNTSANLIAQRNRIIDQLILSDTYAMATRMLIQTATLLPTYYTVLHEYGTGVQDEPWLHVSAFERPHQIALSCNIGAATIAIPCSCVGTSCQRKIASSGLIRLAEQCMRRVSRTCMHACARVKLRSIFRFVFVFTAD